MTDFSPPQVAASAPQTSTPSLPTGVAIASPWLRLGAYLVEGILVGVTLGIGWLIWAAMIAGSGQTPAKRLLKMRVIRHSTMTPVGFGTMLFMRGIVAGLVATIAIPITLGIILLMPFWDKRNQNIWDKVSSTYVVTDPNDAWSLKPDLR
jgi:uncharacterized RDD family membrane protein YckC